MNKRGRKKSKSIVCTENALTRQYEVEHYTKSRSRNDGYFYAYMISYRHRKVVLKIVINATQA